MNCYRLVYARWIHAAADDNRWEMLLLFRLSIWLNSSQDSGRLLDFEYTDEDILSLRKQMGHPRGSISLVNINSSPGMLYIFRDHNFCLFNTEQQRSSNPPLSPVSSVVSEAPKPSKKRRISSSSLSDADENADSDDDEEDRPLAARIVGRTTGGKRSGKQMPGKKSKKAHPQTGKSAPTHDDGRPPTSPTKNGRKNGYEPRIKIEERMDEGQINRLTAGVPTDAVGSAVSTQ